MNWITFIRTKLFFWSSCLFLFTLLFPIKINNIAIGAMIFGAIVNSENHLFRNNSQLARRLSPLILFYLVYIVTIFYSSNFSDWKHHAEVKSTFLIMPLLFWWQSYQFSVERVNRLIVAFILGVVSITLYLLAVALSKYIETGVSDYFYYHELTDPLRLHAIYLANYLAVVVLVSLHMHGLFNYKNGLTVRICLVVFSMLVIFLLSALSVMVFLMIWLLLFLIREISKKSLVNVVGVVVVFFLCVLVVFKLPYTRMKIERMYSIDYRMEDPDYAWNSLTIRLAMWTCGYQIVQKNLIFGVGAGDEQQSLMDSYSENNFKEGIRCEYNCHNQYLSTLISSGIIGLAFLLLVLLSPIYSFIREKDNLILIGFILLIALGLLTENMFALQKGTILFAAFYAILQLNRPKSA